MRRDYVLTRRAWRPALIGAGLEADRFVFHSLRHFAASSMLAEGAPITAVAGHLGDTVETVQRTYAHWLRDDRGHTRRSPRPHSRRRSRCRGGRLMKFCVVPRLRPERVSW